MRVLSKWSIGRPPKICVVGAGIAGLRCTEILLTQGVDVTIMEARSRVGGRVSAQVLQGGTLLLKLPCKVDQTTIGGHLIDL